MAGLDRKKTGTNQTSWEFYIEGNDEWLNKPLRADLVGKLYGPDGKTEAYTFKKGEPIQILDLKLHMISGKKLAHVNVSGIVGWTLPKNISKPTTSAKISAGGAKVQEIQEKTVIDAINEAVAANGGRPISLTGLNRTDIHGVIGAYKVTGVNSYRKEMYADMLLDTVLGDIMVSMKMERSPTLFGGGFQALYDMAPRYITGIFQEALRQAIRDPGFELGSNTKLKDIFIHITNRDFLRMAIKGSIKMGGPIDYMFVGKRIPRYEFDDGELKFVDSSFFTIEQYESKFPKFYIRIRRRDTTQIFTNELDKTGMPYFFKRRVGQERARIVIEKTLSGRALVIKT